MTPSGKVYLVGAGPGDPDLMTVKGMALVRTADVIIHDRLIPPGILGAARPDAVIFDVGKVPYQRRFEQEDINALIVSQALAGKMVVRLKGGDSFVFGRGGEEGLACRAVDVPFEVVPGVSSAIAAPAMAGIPVTHRHVTASFTVFSAHEDPTKAVDQVDYEAMAQSGGTLVALMAVRHMLAAADRLIAAGMSADTPVALIENGTLPNQRVIEGTLGTIAALAAAADVQPPAVLVIGEVVRLRAAGLAPIET
ncbi:MAG: uroporphyrinogen-III C-methyltransferase [Chloroflexota bacterium]|nr:uroporphyrinogen-III C-methyltransferase [Chloroflexota bacterium]